MEDAPKLSSRLKKLFRWTLFILAALTTLGALFFAEEDWRGSRAWSHYKREMEAKGERFDAARLIPPKIGDGQNLAMIPFFTKAEGIMLPESVTLPRRPAWHYGVAADLTNWAEAFGSPGTNTVQAATTVLGALKRDNPLLTELETARRRPSCRFDIDYENWWNDTNVQAATFEQFAQVKKFFRVMSLRAQAELVSGQSDQALDDIDLMFRVNGGLRDEPLFISQLVGYATIEVLLRPIAQGLAEHRWSDTQLRVLQERLQRTDLLASTRLAVEGERAFCANPFFNGVPFKPRGWDRMEQLNFNRAIQETVLPRIDWAARQIDPRLNHSCDVAVANLSQNAFFHHRIFAAMTLPAYELLGLRTGSAQTDVDEVRVACALERYRLAEGNYPESLAALAPRFATILPRDLMDGQPLGYRRNDEGQFILYSVGWNQADDGGKIATNRDGSQDKSRGDWVFEYPTRRQLKTEVLRAREKPSRIHIPVERTMRKRTQSSANREIRDGAS